MSDEITLKNAVYQLIPVSPRKVIKFFYFLFFRLSCNIANNLKHASVIKGSTRFIK